MTPQEAAEKAQETEMGFRYPDRPDKPTKLPGETNEAYGKRLDNYEMNDMVRYRSLVKDYRQSCHAVKETFKVDLLKALGLENHPKRDKLFEMAWNNGHSSGYSEVANEAEELAELL